MSDSKSVAYLTVAGVQILYSPPKTIKYRFQHSTMVVQSPVKGKVVSSSLTAGAKLERAMFIDN